MLLMDETFIEKLKGASTPDEFLEIIDAADNEKPDLDDQLAAQSSQTLTDAACRILAVTSCPTGIAHTYMAAEGLEKAAKAKNCFIKVETRGSGGAKNVLTEQEIQEADCIIIAADAQVPMERFHGKKLIECQVSDGISKADQLIERAAFLYSKYGQVLAVTNDIAIRDTVIACGGTICSCDNFLLILQNSFQEISLRVKYHNHQTNNQFNRRIKRH